MTSRTWTFESKSTAGQFHTTKLAESGLLSCSCKGWTQAKGEKPRCCVHMQDPKNPAKGVIPENGFTTRIEGRFVFVVESAAPATQATLPVTAAADSVRAVTTRPVVVKATAAQVASAAPAAKSMSVPPPMLASAQTKGQLEGAAFDAKWANDNFVMQEKIDGVRVTTRKRGTERVSWSRPGPTAKAALVKVMPPHIAEALDLLPDCVIDGELAVPGGNSWDVISRANETVYIVFDVLEVMGQSTMHLPYTERHAMLELVVAHVSAQQDVAPIFCLPVMTPSWARVQEIWAAGGEGAIVKAKKATYRPGYRTDQWTKVVLIKTATMTISGFTAGVCGPCSVWNLTGPIDIKSIKHPNQALLREATANPAAFIGRRIVIAYTERGGKPMHPRVDHWAGDGE
jgi:hypothetical protein